MVTYSMPMCFRCRHFDLSVRKGNFCSAFPFPFRIPNEILYSQFDHTEPYPNAENPKDNGIRFEPIDET